MFLASPERSFATKTPFSSKNDFKIGDRKNYYESTALKRRALNTSSSSRLLIGEHSRSDGQTDGPTTTTTRRVENPWHPKLLVVPRS